MIMRITITGETGHKALMTVVKSALLEKLDQDKLFLRTLPHSD